VRRSLQLALIAIFFYIPASFAAVNAPRFAVPILCTENPSARTRTVGTGIVIDPAGTIVTAAHVVSVSRVLCTLTVIVPHAEWSQALGFHTFSLKECVSNEVLDVALCRIEPLSSPRDRAYLIPARIRIAVPRPASAVTITGFTGWGLLPTILDGFLLTPQQLYRREDGCYCDFAVGVSVHPGMSGSPLINASGDVVGLITVAGTGKFRGVSFGTSFERAAAFLRKNGVTFSADRV